MNFEKKSVRVGLDTRKSRLNFGWSVSVFLSWNCTKLSSQIWGGTLRSQRW